MYTNHIRRIAKRKKGNSQLIAIVIILIPIIVSAIAQLIITTRYAQLRNEEQVRLKYIDYSLVEIAGFEAINNINAHYLEDINVETISNACRLKIATLLNKDIYVEIVNNIESENEIQVKINIDNANYSMEINNISLIEIPDTEDEDVVHYLIDCNLCELRRTISNG